MVAATMQGISDPGMATESDVVAALRNRLGPHEFIGQQITHDQIPTCWVAAAGLQDALRYLKDSELSIPEITFLLGYNEVSSFNHAFKRWTGMTPKQAR